METIKETVKKMLMDKIGSLKEPILPEALNDERLEDAFKEPECDEHDQAPLLPNIWNSNRYGKTADGVKIISLKSASSASGSYARYVDEEALVWDDVEQELFLYVPDKSCPAVALRGGRWLCAKKLKLNYWLDVSIYDVYKELQAKIKEELNLKNE